MLKSLQKTSVLIALFALILTACNTQKSNSEINFAIAQAPLNLDPRYATDAASARVNRLLYQSLVDFDANAKPIAQLASWVQINPTQYQFELKPNRANFHHGKA
ncbi:MAG: ABC transporter substrate-binding protein, partial [Pseudomonadota bacterium]